MAVAMTGKGSDRAPTSPLAHLILHLLGLEEAAIHPAQANGRNTGGAHRGNNPFVDLQACSGCRFLGRSWRET